MLTSLKGMDATLPSVLVLLGLVVFNGAPLVAGACAAVSSSRRAGARGYSRVFWALAGSYLGSLALIGLFLIQTVAHPQQEGLAAFSEICFVSVLGLPGSIVPLLAGVGVSDGSIVRPWGLSSMSTWFVVGTLCWQFLFLVGLRWLSQLRARRGARTTDRVHAGELAGRAPS